MADFSMPDTLSKVIERLTEGHLNGKKFAEVGPDSKRKRVNLIQVKPLTVKIEDSGLEMVRPMRINRMSSVRQARVNYRIFS